MVDPQTLDETDVLIRTVYGEARGESAAGQAAVAWVILNRAAKGRAHMGTTIKGVCLKPSQFSCWNSNDPNRNSLLTLNKNSEPYKNIGKVVEEVLNGTRTDDTKGSTHYHTSRVKPNWANNKNPVVTIGNHLFYNDVN